MENRFAGGCVRCSVLVLPGGGFLHKGDDSWQVWCAICQRVAELAKTDDFDSENLKLPETVPPGSATTVALRVLGMTRECWKCGKDTLCLVGLYPARPARGYGGLHTTDGEAAMELAVRLVQSNGRPDLAALVTSRYSRVMRERQLANGCQHCDALQGNHPVHEEAFARVVAAGGADGLDTLMVADCPLLEWQAVVHGQDGGVIGV
ncbi:hypothetical protein AB0O31_31690 [Kitasatospora cineracea]|uniref:hypothetical protein n=1 Tax=Kitasatospora cineracea TaxID=88074 RepID=UPI0034368036